MFHLNPGNEARTSALSPAIGCRAAPAKPDPGHLMTRRGGQPGRRVQPAEEVRQVRTPVLDSRGVGERGDPTTPPRGPLGGNVRKERGVEGDRVLHPCSASFSGDRSGVLSREIQTWRGEASRYTRSGRTGDSAPGRPFAAIGNGQGRRPSFPPVSPVAPVRSEGVPVDRHGSAGPRRMAGG